MKSGNRSKMVIFAISTFYIAIFIKLVYIQIIRYPVLNHQLISQNFSATPILPLSGSILDASGSTLLTFQTNYQISLYKPDLKISDDKIITYLTELNSTLSTADIDKLTKFIQNPKQKWLKLASLFSKQQIDQLSDPGISITTITLPHYPEGELGQSYLQKNGLLGYYNRLLSGKTGFTWATKDAVGKNILTHPGWIIDPQPGTDVSTFINRQVQFITEKTLSKGITEFSADSGEIIIMDTKTGGIIAMSSIAATASAESTPSSTRYQNTSVTNLFEPGSIVKPLIMSLALDTNSIQANYICDKCDRPHQIGQYQISNWDSSFHPNSDLKEIIKNSDNIGMSYIIQQTGIDKFSKYFKLLGFDRKTGIDLQNESRPLEKKYWPEIDLATASFGQGFAVTQIQMITAFNSLANDGIKVSPHFNKSQKPLKTKIFGSTTISEIKSILKYSVENGVVAKFKPKDMEVCGKSGTSQVAVKGGYSSDTTIASYIGFSPCQNPKFTMIVTIHNPKSSPWGSSTAAPIWYEIAEKIEPLL